MHLRGVWYQKRRTVEEDILLPSLSVALEEAIMGHQGLVGMCKSTTDSALVQVVVGTMRMAYSSAAEGPYRR